jgi:hypothetical protein
VFGPLLFERKQVLSARLYPNTHIQELFCPSCLLLCVFVVFFFPCGRSRCSITWVAYSPSVSS